MLDKGHMNGFIELLSKGHMNGVSWMVLYYFSYTLNQRHNVIYHLYFKNE